MILRYDLDARSQHKVFRSLLSCYQAVRPITSKQAESILKNLTRVVVQRF